MGFAVLLGQFGEFPQVLGLLVGQAVRDFDDHPDELIPTASTADMRKSLALQTEDLV